MPTRPCLDCGALVNSARCAGCERGRSRVVTRAKRERRPYTNRERERRADVVQTWRATVGDWCPGFGVPAHHSMDLTADHPTAVGAGGSESQSLSVLCRSCNGRKSDRPALG